MKVQTLELSFVCLFVTRRTFSSSIWYFSNINELSFHLLQPIIHLIICCPILAFPQYLHSHDTFSKNPHLLPCPHSSTPIKSSAHFVVGCLWKTNLNVHFSLENLVWLHFTAGMCTWMSKIVRMRVQLPGHPYAIDIKVEHILCPRRPWRKCQH